MLFLDAEKNDIILYNQDEVLEMNLGNKILELRKKSGFSQEELSEKIDVTRQTISRWELNESSPDLKQAKELSKIFKVSLDELVDNDIKNILEEKISNTERLAGLIIKILKVFGIGMVITLIIFTLYQIFRGSTYAWFVNEGITLNCTLNGKNYSYKVLYGVEESSNQINDNNHMPEKIINLERMEGSAYLGEIIDIEKYEYYYQFIEGVYGYFAKNGGKCD